MFGHHMAGAPAHGYFGEVKSGNRFQLLGRNVPQAVDLGVVLLQTRDRQGAFIDALAIRRRCQRVLHHGVDRNEGDAIRQFDLIRSRLRQSI